MSIKVRVSYEIEVDGPATISAYGIALGFALQGAARNAVKVADTPAAEVRMGEVKFELAEGGEARRG